MFTGLVQAVGRVGGVEESAAGLRLVVEAPDWDHVPRRESSVAVNGCCLTVANEPAGRGSPIAFDVIHETLSKTTLGGLVPGSRVNLEHAATPQTLMGGHLVQGHVDGVGEVVRVQRGGDGGWRVRIRPGRGSDGEGLMQYIVPKGSICVDGASLTVAAVDLAGEVGGVGGGGEFEVALIPTTLERTTLGEFEEGRRVNLEVDLVAKTIVHWAKHFGPGRGGGEGAR